MGGHLSEERLLAEVLTSEEQAHLAACFRCRADRRVAHKPVAPTLRGPPYQLVRFVDSGGMGVVYEARHAVLGTRHAVKLLRVHDPQLSARMIREGRLQARLTHRHIVPVQEVIELDGLPALVMPFIEGPTLAKLLKRRVLPADVAYTLFHAVVLGVAEIHRARMVHRDLKPGNIMLEVQPSEVIPRVTDFGLAKTLALSSGTLQTRTGAMMGTPVYAAPEQLVDAASVGPAADVFSLGTVLYELLVGSRPFEGSERHLPVVPVDGELGEVIRQCLAARPADRPADAVALLARLPAPTVGLDALLPWCRDLWSAAPPTAAPPLKLPRESSPFFGREIELAWLDDALSRHRLATVHGPGGLGKTRALLRYGLTRGPRYRGGALWVDASEADGEDGLVNALEGGEEALMARGPMLLLVELPPTGSLEPIERWLRWAPELVVLAAGREKRLRGPGLRLAGLGVAEAAALFVDRASASRPGLRPSSEELAQIAELALRLDGHPLAIELAAARLRGQSLEELLVQLKTQLPERIEPLQAMLDATWARLEPVARSVLLQLSAMEGSFSLEQAEQRVELASDADVWLPDLVQELSDLGLLQSLDADGAVQMRLHASLRDYASEKISAAGTTTG